MILSIKNISIKYLTVLFLFTISLNRTFSQSINNADVEKKYSTSNIVCMETSLGKLILELYDKTPLHQQNFLKLLDEKFYDSIKFHRVINSFMAQAGDPNSKKSNFSGQLGQQSYGSTIPAEIIPDYFHKKGALAAARMGDNINPEKRSSGSQFYIVQGKTYTENQLYQIEQKINQQEVNNLIGQFLKKNKNIDYVNRIKYCQQQSLNDSLNLLYQEIKSLVFTKEFNKFKFSESALQAYKTIGGTPFLDNGYTVFGQVIEGIELIDKICAVPTKTNDIPLEPIVILSATKMNKYD